MVAFPPTIIWRHRKENLKKCSLQGLEQRKDFRFFTYPQDPLPALDGYIYLTLGAPVLSFEERASGLFLIDGTWNYAEKMQRQLPCGSSLKKRSLPPHFLTAYPRRQTGCQNPASGLASIEALFIAYHILGRATEGLLDQFHWAEPFLHTNRFFNELTF